ncbi:MAG TPA: helix-turn-helix domain-containing protein [Solirubrobacterales bacterium]|nr:helix-turn-helix domain-containing protein [Solirubrobacterales bacterium]
MLGAAAEVLAERGYAGTKSSDIARLAHVSRATFYEHFENVADCLLAAHEMAADCALDIVSGACEQGGEWTTRLGAAIDATLHFLAAEPALARLFGAELSAGVPAVAISHRELVSSLASLLAASRSGADAARSASVEAQTHLIDGALMLITDRVAAGDAETLPGLAQDLTAVFAA